jgi:23S rRNA pseudouridine2605 synthase
MRDEKHNEMRNDKRSEQRGEYRQERTAESGRDRRSATSSRRSSDRNPEPMSDLRSDARTGKRPQRDDRRTTDRGATRTQRSGAPGVMRRDAAGGKREEVSRTPERATPARLRSSQPGAEVEHTSELRLNKFLADAGISSRRSADELIEAGVVKVNGVVVTEQGTKVHPADLVTVRGEPVSYIKHLTYLVLNKPKDYITTTSDEKGRKTVMDLIPLKQRLYPVGRLDRNTTGALIITNDGELATRLMHPRYEIEREYVVGLDKRLTSEHAKSIANGVTLEDGTTGPAEVLINPEDRTEVHIILREGKNREVRRLFEHFGYEVLRLHRVRYAHVTVSGLSRGEYRHLTRDEVRALRKRVKID